MPKSITFTRPSRVTMMLAGLMSRWITPCACAAASASATFSAMPAALVGASRPPLARYSARVRPSTYSMTM